MFWMFAEQRYSWCPMSNEPVPDMGENAEFGWCLAVLIGPNGKDRFYGPFESETFARAWINGQGFTAHDSVGIMPLRRTDIIRERWDFHNPQLDWDAKDFWSVVVKGKNQ